MSVSAVAQVSASFKVQTLPTNTNVNNIVLADLNGDGIPDLIETYSTLTPNGFSVQLGQGNGTFASPVTYTFPVQNQGPAMATTADVNGDGKTDVIIAINPFMPNSPGMLLVYLGNGNGTLASPGSISFQSFINALAPADFNHTAR